MYLVKVELIEKNYPRKAPGINNTYYDKDGLHITIETSLPYAFCFECDKHVAVGESIIPLNSNEIKALVDQVRITDDYNNFLGNELLSLIIVNTDQKKIFLANNISSCRPCYYSFNEQGFICSSSIKHMKAMGFQLELDETSLPEYLTYRFVTPPKTLFKNIYQPLGGQTIKFDFENNIIVNKQFFNFHLIACQANNHPDEYAPTCENILGNNIRNCLQHYDKPGILLSGGVDSSLLAALTVPLSSKVNSISSSFRFLNKDDEEDEYASSVARHLGINHSIYCGSSEEYLSGLVESIYHAENPVHHLQSVMLYLLFKNRASEENKVLLNGEAADGLFGNYAHVKFYKYRRILSLMQRPGIRSLYRLALMLTGLRNDYRFSYFGLDFNDSQKSDNHFLWSLGQYSSTQLIEKYFLYDQGSIVSSHRELMEPYINETLLNKISIISLLCEGHITMSIWSKLAESQNIAMYYPFATADLISYIFSVPWDVKLREGKYLIRQMLSSNNIPEAFISRPKRSFGFPYHYWALPGTLFQPIVDMAGEMFDRNLLKNLQTIEPEKAMLLWNLLNLYLWKKMFVENIDPEQLTAEILDRHYKSNKTT